jgi:hypothetical protein
MTAAFTPAVDLEFASRERRRILPPTEPNMERHPMESSRTSIAGLMGLVVVAAIGLAGLRTNSSLWAGVVFLLTCGVLALAAIAAISRRDSERAWWLGVAIFGWGYLALVFASSDYDGVRPQLPTSLALIKLDSKLRIPDVDTGPIIGFDRGQFERHRAFYHVGHSLFALLAAVLGGAISRFLLGGPLNRSNGGTAEQKLARAGLQSDADSASKKSRYLRFRTTCAVGAAIAVAGFIALFFGSIVLASVTFLLTCAWLALVTVGMISSRGSRRARWGGAALFGWGYFFLAFNSYAIDSTWPFAGELEPPYLLTVGDFDYVYTRYPRLERWLPQFGAGNFRDNAGVLNALEQPLTLHFPQETPFEDVLSYIRSATRNRNLPDGLRLYVDPVALQEAEKTMTSPVTIDIENVPLRVSLRLVLKQLDLHYVIENGFIKIMTPAELDNLPIVYDPVWRVLHCAIALFAACLGGVLAPLVYDAHGESEPADCR